MRCVFQLADLARGRPSFWSLAFGAFICSLLPSSGQVRYTPYRFVTIAGSAQHAYDPTNTDPAFNIVGGYLDSVGTNALFFWPMAVATDRKGNVFVADAGNSLIRKITSRRAVSTIAGRVQEFSFADGVGTNALFNNPLGVAVDRHGHVFVVDSFNNTIRQMTRIGDEWVVSTVAGEKEAIFGGGLKDGFGGEARFSQPSGIAVDIHGVLYVADRGNNNIREIKRDGTNWIVSTIAGSTQIAEDEFHGRRGYADGLGTNALFNRPTAIVADRRGSLFVTDENNHVIRRLRRVSRAGPISWEVTTIAGLPGNLGRADGVGTNALFNTPRGIAVGSGGSIFVGDSENFTIRKITRTHGKWLVKTIGGTPAIAGFQDGRGANALFGRTNVWNGVLGQFSGLTVKGCSIFVADRFNSTIRRGRSN